MKLQRRNNSINISIHETGNDCDVVESSRIMDNGRRRRPSHDDLVSNWAPIVRNDSTASLKKSASKTSTLAPIKKDREFRSYHSHNRKVYKYRHHYWFFGITVASCLYCYIQTQNLLEEHTSFTTSVLRQQFLQDQILRQPTDNDNTTAEAFISNHIHFYDNLNPRSAKDENLKAPHESIMTIQQFWNASMIIKTQRSHQRRLRTQPPILDMKPGYKNKFNIDLDDVHFQEYEYAFLKQKYPNSNSRKNENTEDENWIPADLKHLCGNGAKQAASQYPKHYPSRHALLHKRDGKKKYKKNNHNPQRFYRPDHSNNSLEQEPRVLITGILNPIGFMLALKLGQECGISTIMGIDNMLPNTLIEKQEMLRRVSILRREIPSLQDYLDINVPIFGLSPRLSKADQKRLEKEGVITNTTTSCFMNNTNACAAMVATGELNLMHIFAPTHIIHLTNAFDIFPTKPGDNPFYTLKHTTSSIEYILSSIATEASRNQNNSPEKHPHLTFVSTLPPQNYDNGSSFYQVSKVLEIFLTRTYYDLYGVSSVGLQFDSVYGPMGTPEMPTYDLASLLVSSNCWDGTDHGESNSTIEPCDQDYLFNVTSFINYDSSNNDETHNYLFVDDVVDTIITTMQYQNQNHKSLLFQLESSDNLNYHELIRTMFLFRPIKNPHQSSAVSVNKAISSLNVREKRLKKGLARDHLHWNSKTNLFHGLSKLLAWHLDHSRPFNNDLSVDVIPKRVGNNFQTEITQKIHLESGNQFLNRMNEYSNESDMICSPSDTVCLRDATVFPCASECSDTQLCKTSPLDEIVEVGKSITNDCSIVVYTFLPDNVQIGRGLKKPPNKENKTKFDPRKICYLAFMSQKRKKQLISNQNIENDITHKDWIILGISDWESFGEEKVSLLLKLSPGRFFASNVQYSMYTDNSFETPPSYDNVLYLIDSMFMNRSQKEQKNPIFLANSLFRGGHKRKLGEAIDAMKEARDWEKNSKKSLQIPIMPQSTFYTYYLSNMNRKDLRCTDESSYTFEFKVWIDGIKVLHSLKKEDARQLRCEWYSEHLQFQNKLDQLSLAMVIARRELMRKVVREEPDQEETGSKTTNDYETDNTEKKSCEDFSVWLPLAASLESSNHITFKSTDTDKRQRLPLSHVKIQDQDESKMCGISKERAEWKMFRLRWKDHYEMKNKLVKRADSIVSSVLKKIEQK